MDNNSQSLEETLLDIKIKDFYLASATLPTKARVLSKLFARTLGSSSGKILMGYEKMLECLRAGQDVRSTQKSVERLIDAESKVNIKIPLLKPRRARLCGLVALNHSGFFEPEAQLYGALFNDLGRNEYETTRELIEDIQQLGKKEASTYAPILRAKRESIHDFAVLMGIDEDKQRLGELTRQMPRKLGNYFKMVARLHWGGKLGISWPLSFKKFSSPIKLGLQGDTPSYFLQRGIEEDYGFTNPEENRSSYRSLLRQISENVLPNKSLRNLGVLPAAFFYLSGLQAYAHEVAGKTVEEVAKQPDYIGPALTASTFASSLADDEASFVTSWFTTFTTLV
jgi:hypothetical protein